MGEQLALDVLEVRSFAREAASGTVEFLSPEARAEASEREGREGLIVVGIRPTSAMRGRLGDAIDDAIERELSARGCTGPGFGAGEGGDALLSDQLYRARRLGAFGLFLRFESMQPLLTAHGVLGVEDSATLRSWAKATRERPITIVFDASDEAIGACGEPVALATWIGAGREDADDAPIATTPETPRAKADETFAARGAQKEDEEDVTSVIAEAAAKLEARARSEFVGASIATPNEAAWRNYALALTAARGPQPLASFERLFAQSYLPLANALAHGLDDPRARAAHDEFRRTFSKSYAEACPTFALTGKRPKMVLDAPDIATRLARLHGARVTQLLLVDGMRFDLGALIRDEVVSALSARASLTEEAILWSALPTITSRQFETLARGVEALRSPPESEREIDPMRGRTAEVIRRVKVGARDVYKLDIVESRIREATDHALDAFPDIARAAADAIVRHSSTLAARTLLFVFGDHGFRIDASGQAEQGGASPEEVMVPAFALLLGELH